MGKKKSIGLPGGPNEFLQDITQYISVEGYKSYSPDKNNPVNIIESGSITMQDVDFPVYGVDNLGNEQMMFPENEYQFPGDTVYEIPMAKDGKEQTYTIKVIQYPPGYEGGSNGSRGAMRMDPGHMESYIIDQDKLPGKWSEKDEDGNYVYKGFVNRWGQEDKIYNPATAVDLDMDNLSGGDYEEGVRTVDIKLNKEQLDHYMSTAQTFKHMDSDDFLKLDRSISPSPIPINLKQFIPGYDLEDGVYDLSESNCADGVCDALDINTSTKPGIKYAGVTDPGGVMNYLLTLDNASNPKGNEVKWEDADVGKMEPLKNKNVANTASTLSGVVGLADLMIGTPVRMGKAIGKWFGFEEGGELPEHLQGIDLTKINTENSSKINSEAYRNRLKTEYFNAHNIELSDVDLDNMIGDLNNQLTLGADDGTKGFYTQNVPDPNAAGFMMGGYGQIDQDGNQVNQRTEGYDWNNPTRGNIYIARNASQKAPFNEIDDEDGYVMPGTSMEESIIQHEVNHRLNSLQGSPLSSAATSPLYDESYEYHNSFFGNAPDDNPFNAKFEDESFRAYATQPFEIKSQKAQLEQALSNAGIWDPSKGPFTQADVDKMVERNITFNKGFGYLPRGLGINELVEGTIKAPGKLTNPMNSYSKYIGDKFDNFLGKKGAENFGDYYSKDFDMRNTSSRPFEQIKRNLNSVEQGSEKWNEWSDKYQTATTQYYNARGDSKGIKDALNGEYPNEKTKALLLERGIKVGPDGWYEPEMDDQINTVLNEYQEKTNAFKNARDLISDKRPKEEGLFGAFGPIKNFKGKKAEKEAVKRFNKVYKTDFKEWKDIEFEHYEGGVSQADKNIKKVVTETSIFDDMKTSFDREINTLQDLQKTGGHENRKAFYKNDFKVNGDYRKGRRTGRNEFNMDMANAYMSSLKSNPETNKEGTDVFDNSYVPPNVFDNAGGYAYYPREEGKKLREQNRTNFKTAVDNGVWRDDLFTQAVLNLRANDRDAFIEYYNQDPDAKYTTKKEIKQQAKLLKQLKSSMPDIRNFLEKKRTETSNFIKDNNSQYEVDKEQQLINDNLRNKNLNEKIAPNLIKFMNEVAMEDESMPTELAQAGIELPIAQADATNVYQQNPNILIAQEETVMPGSGIIYDPTRASRNPNLQWMMGAQPGVTPGTSYADDVAIGYNELIGATTPIPILEGLQLTSKGARIPGLIDDGIIKPIVKGYKWMKSSLSSGSKASSSGIKTTEVLNEPDLEAMADRLDEMNDALIKSFKNADSIADKDAAAELWAKNNLDEITAMRKLTDKMPKSKVSSEIKKKLKDINIGDGGSQIKKTDLEVYINPKTGEIEQFHSLKDGKVTAEDLEANLPWEIDWAGNINLDEYATLLKKIPSHSTPYKKDEFGMIDLYNRLMGKDKVINYGPWKNQKGGEPAIQDNTFIAAIPEVIIDQASENNKKENQELGLSNILSYIVETRGGTENLWTDLADNIAYHESGYEQRMDPKAIQRSNEYVDGKKTGNIIPGPGRGMFQFESKELNGSGSFSTAQKRYKNVAEAAKKYYIDKGLDGSGFELNENILNAKEATELSKQDQYTLFFANLIESKAVLKDYADGKLSAEDIWLKGHKNVSADGNKESFRASVKKAKELEPNGIKKGFSEFTLEDLLLYKSGGEYNIFQDYVTGNYDNTDNKKQAEKIYDKLNRIHYKEAKEAGMSPANYIMTNLMGHS
jgi:hypothetical protein